MELSVLPSQNFSVKGLKALNWQPKQRALPGAPHAPHAHMMIF